MMRTVGGKSAPRAASVLSSLFDSDDGLGGTDVPGSPWRPDRVALVALDRRHAAELARASYQWLHRARQMRLRAQAQTAIDLVTVEVAGVEDVRRALLAVVPPELEDVLAPFDSRTADFLVRSLDLTRLRTLLNDFATTVAALLVIERRSA